VTSRLDPYALVRTTYQGRYDVEAFAGVGRFSAVYRAKDSSDAGGRNVCLRILKLKEILSLSQRTIVLDRLSALTRPLTEIAGCSPSLSDLLEVGTVTSAGRWAPVLVQTWAAGETLENVLGREKGTRLAPRSLVRVIDLLTPVADALGYAHARGLVHGSLSPRTLVVRDPTRDDWEGVTILDLGIARALAGMQEKDRAFADVSGGPLHFFAPSHGSPEQFAGESAHLGPAADVFALALVVAELVSGASPLGEGNDEQLRAAAIDPATRPTPRAHQRELGGYVEAVLSRALAVRASDRHGSVSAFWEALRAASRMTTLRPSSGSVRPPPLPTDLAKASRDPSDPEAATSGIRELIGGPLKRRQSSGALSAANAKTGSVPPPLPAPTPPPSTRESRPPLSPRGSTPPPGFFESPPPLSVPGTNPLFAGEPRERAKAS